MTPISCDVLRSTRRLVLTCVLLVPACLMGAWGCAGEPPAKLLDLQALAPDGDPDAGQYTLSGEGLPVGRTGSVSLEGVVHRPGKVPRSVRASISGRVASDGRFRFSIADQRSLAHLAPGNFVGAVTLAFETEHAQVSGALPNVELPLAATTTRARREQLLAARRGSEWWASLGASELEVASDRQGVIVGSVDAQGAAYLAGLRGGDRIVRLAGAPVTELSDLWPRPGGAVVAARAERGEVDEPVPLSLPRSAVERVSLGPHLDWGVGVGLCMAALVLLWPVRQVSRARPGPGVPLMAHASGCALGLVALAGMLGDEVHVVRGVATPTGLLCAMALWRLWPRGHAVDGDRSYNAARAWVPLMARLSLAALSVASAGLLVGTLRPVWSPPGGASFEVPLLGVPAAWLSLWLGHAALRTDALPSTWRPAMAAMRFAVVAALVALLGGAGAWADGLSPSPWLVWSLKSFALWCGLELLAPLRPATPLLLVTLALATPASVLAWAWIEPGPRIEATLGLWVRCAFGSAALRTLVLRVRDRWWPAPEIDPGLVPFL